MAVLLRIAAKDYAAPGGLAVELSNAAKWGLRARYYAQVKGGAGYLRVVPTGGEVLRRPEQLPPDRQHASLEAGSPASLPLLVIGHSCICRRKEGSMPRQKSLLTVIRELVQQEVRSAIQSLLGSVSTAKQRRTGAAVAGVGAVPAVRRGQRTRRRKVW